MHMIVRVQTSRALGSFSHFEGYAAVSDLVSVDESTQAALPHLTPEQICEAYYQGHYRLWNPDVVIPKADCEMVYCNPESVGVIHFLATTLSECEGSEGWTSTLPVAVEEELSLRQALMLAVELWMFDYQVAKLRDQITKETNPDFRVEFAARAERLEAEVRSHRLRAVENPSYFSRK